MDPIFEEEQRHLSETYAKLQRLERTFAERLEANLKEVQGFKGDMNDELSLDFDRFNADVDMETYSAIAVMNNVVDSFNISIDLDAENLARARQLLRKPYFAKVRLKFPHRAEPRDIYLGSAGIADEMHRQIVVDWRSPVAETYYNQQTGPTSYEANGRTIEVDLQLRRQFDVDRDRLNAYFDTTVAIEDPMLLESLSQHRSAQLQAITATIQREQNLVIRHEDVPALLVRGVAGSGKTSVMLQRIAFLLFRERASLNAEQVYLITPNPVFARYIKDVLPELGEKNPRTLMWPELMALLGPGDRSLGNDTDPATLRRIDEGVAGLALEPADVAEVRVGDRVLLTVEQVWKTIEKHARVPMGPRRMALVEEDLLEKLERRADQLAGSDSLRDELAAMDDDEQDRVFGRPVDLQDEEELAACAREYADGLCAQAAEVVERGDWLRYDRIGMRMLGALSLSAVEWVYLKLALTGKADLSAKFVMVDEVQDYSAAQLMVLARYFARAHFLMLGDPNQAIRPGTAGFDEIRAVFEAERGQVDECELMTSYRSSPEITALFARLLPEDERIKLSSVRRPGEEPRIVACADLDAYRAEMVAAVREAAGEEGLAAVVVNSPARVRWLSKLLTEEMGDEAPTVVREGSTLPERGVVLIDLALAKGLEFDRVIVPDAQAEEFPAGDDLARRRLYTAVSRATQHVTVVAQGELTPLLVGAAGVNGEGDPADEGPARGAAQEG